MSCTYTYKNKIYTDLEQLKLDIGQEEIRTNSPELLPYFIPAYDLLRNSGEVIPHEYAHHYIAWFRDTPIVQEAIKKWGSEEALVQSIGEQVVKQKGEAYNWWNKFVKWIMNQFNSLSKLQKEELTQILTDAFLTRQELGSKQDIENFAKFVDSGIDTSRKVSAKGKMTFSYGNNKRADIKSTTTFEAIKNGERTATTRYESDGHIDYWKKLKEGDIIEWESSTGEKVLVEVTKPLHKLVGSGKTAEQWSKLEGWSVDYFNSKVKPRLYEAWQIEYKSLKPNVVDSSEGNEKELPGLDNIPDPQC